MSILFKKRRIIGLLDLENLIIYNSNKFDKIDK